MSLPGWAMVAGVTRASLLEAGSAHPVGRTQEGNEEEIPKLLSREKGFTAEGINAWKVELCQAEDTSGFGHRDMVVPVPGIGCRVWWPGWDVPGM